MNKKQQLINKLSPPLDGRLVALLLSEFIAMERNFLLGAWEPTTLDGGQFCEIAARIIYHMDSGNLNQRKKLHLCLQYVEDSNNANPHSFPDRQAARHLCQTIRTVYKFRSQRGAIHIDPDYTANELDSTLVIGISRWIISEILRIFWAGDNDKIAEAIRQVIRYEVPAVMVTDNQRLVLRTDCTVEEEVLLLLHGIGESGMTRRAIGQSVPKSPSSVTGAIKKLQSAREIFHKSNGHYALTLNGVKRIREELSGKLKISSRG